MGHAQVMVAGMSKKWQLILIVANPYQGGGKGGGKYSVCLQWVVYLTLSLSQCKREKQSVYARLPFLNKRQLLIFINT